jgi:hypothetical protein
VLCPYEECARKNARLGDEGAADAEGALRRALKPHRLQIDADRRKNGNVQNGKNAFRNFFL